MRFIVRKSINVNIVHKLQVFVPDGKLSDFVDGLIQVRLLPPELTFWNPSRIDASFGPKTQDLLCKVISGFCFKSKKSCQTIDKSQQALLFTEFVSF